MSSSLTIKKNVVETLIVNKEMQKLWKEGLIALSFRMSITVMFDWHLIGWTVEVNQTQVC